jgi:hypothetical protein
MPVKVKFLHALVLTARRLVLVNVAESTGGRRQKLSLSPAVPIRLQGAKHGVVFAIMVQFCSVLA